MIPELRTAIGTFLANIHNEVHFEEAPDDAEFPYLVYNLPNSFNDGTMENVVLEIDGWDDPRDGDTTALETMMEAVNGTEEEPGLNRQVIQGGGYAFICYLDNRLNLRDDNPHIRRRKYRYQVRTFQGS